MINIPNAFAVGSEVPTKTYGIF